MIEEILKKYDKIYQIQIDSTGAGFGAVLLTTMNQLRHCERNNLYPVVSYDAESNSAFFDKQNGDELWSQYFESVMPLSYHKLMLLIEHDLSGRLQKSILKLPFEEALKITEEHPESVYSYPFGKWRLEQPKDLDAWYQTQRSRGRETIKKYIKPKTHILEKVTSFYQEHFQGAYVLGVHIRGTDLHYAPVVSPAEYFPHIDAQLVKEPALKIFLATDQAQYIPVFENRYGNKVIYSDSFRSDNEIAPFQRTELSPYKKGEDVLLDILLLSRANFLIKGSSNVGEMAMYFNPNLECLDLGYKKQKAFGQSYNKDWDNHTNPPAWSLISKRGLDDLAKDANSQSLIQLIWYRTRKTLKNLRIYAGKIKKKIIQF